MMPDQDSYGTQGDFSLPRIVWSVSPYTKRCNHPAGHKTPRSIPQTMNAYRTSHPSICQRSLHKPNCLASSLSLTSTAPTRRYPFLRIQDIGFGLSPRGRRDGCDGQQEIRHQQADPAYMGERTRREYGEGRSWNTETCT